MKKKFKPVSIDEETFEMLNEFCNVTGYSKSNFIKGMVRYFKSNKPLITADFFEKKSEKTNKETFLSAKENFEIIVDRQMKKQINRVIAFLKVQDKNLLEFKENVFFNHSSNEINLENKEQLKRKNKENDTEQSTSKSKKI